MRIGGMKYPGLFESIGEFVDAGIEAVFDCIGACIGWLFDKVSAFSDWLDDTSAQKAKVVLPSGAIITTVSADHEAQQILRSSKGQRVTRKFGRCKRWRK